MKNTDDMKSNMNDGKSMVVSLRIDSGFLDKFDDIIGYFAYNRNEAVKESMRRFLDDLVKKKLKIERLKKKSL